MNENPAAEPQPAPPKAGMARKWTFAVLILAFLFVLMPFLFWQSTWFGKPLTDADIAKQLADQQHPRKIQHALSQIADRMASTSPAIRDSAKQWYPKVIELAAEPHDEIRSTAAWVLGLDNSVPEFQATLKGILADSHPLVRRNAALSLVRFADASGREEIRAMLRPYEVPAPREGVLSQRLKPGDGINPGTLIGRIKVGQEEVEVRSLVPGTLSRWLAGEGATVVSGEPLAAVSPSQEMVWEALRALVLIGTPEELVEVDRYARGVAGMPAMVAQQAELTARAIRARHGN